MKRFLFRQIWQEKLFHGTNYSRLDRNGFALIEVLLALLAVSISLMVLGSAAGALKKSKEIHVQQTIETEYFAD